MNQPSDPSVPPAAPRPSTEIGAAPDELAHTHAAQGSTPPSGETDPIVGRVLNGLYRIGERIGEGGMGAVYRAEHVNLKKEFAIKVLTPDVASRDVALERLRQEAVAASSIDHPNIVRVVNLDETEDGLLYIVMELLSGMSLAERIEESVLDAHDAIEIGLQICSALQATHARGIVHRDLKPDNIFLTTVHGETIVKILDFGISKVKRDDAESVRVTKTGQLVGTPLYMSPEQAKGESGMDHRVDIYALGVLLYEMVAGEPPFTGSNYFQILWKHGNEIPPRPSSHDHARAIPHVLEEAILRALAKDPEQRFESMNEFAEELRRAKLAAEITKPDRKGPSRVAIAGGALALLGIGAWWLSNDTTAVEHASAPSMDATAIASPPPPAHDEPHKAEEKADAPESVEPAPAAEPPTLRFELQPSDARVRIGNVILEGPQRYQLREFDPSANDGEIEIEVSHKGYKTEKWRLDPRKTTLVALTLRSSNKNSKKRSTGGKTNIFTDYDN